MNKYGYFDYHNQSRPVEGVSRFDLWVSSVALALFAFAIGTTAMQATSAAELALRSGFTLLIAAAAAVLLRSALLWGKPLAVVPVKSIQLREIRQRVNSYRRGSNARAA